MAWLIAAILGIAAAGFAWAWRRALGRRMAAPPSAAPATAAEAAPQAFIGTLAHDFNNLLGIVIGNLDLVAAQNQDRRLDDALQSALTTALRAAAITRRMSAAAGRQAYRLRPVALDRLLQERLEELRAQAGERHPILAELGSDATVQTDAEALIDALRELVHNAVQAMPDGGTLRLVTRREAGERASLSLVDAGGGMAPELVARAFEPFVTTQRNARGAGLGLAMVRSFCSQSGGVARLQSQPGLGTTVTLELPIVAPVAEKTASQGSLVLVVEDSAAMRRLAVAQLEELGYRTMAFETGEQALEALREAPPVDLLFTDLLLPGALDGRALIAAARRLRPGLKVLVSTGGGDTADLPLLPKPYRKADLARAVANSLAQP